MCSCRTSTWTHTDPPLGLIPTPASLAEHGGLRRTGSSLVVELIPSVSEPSGEELTRKPHQAPELAPNPAATGKTIPQSDPAAFSLRAESLAHSKHFY